MRKIRIRRMEDRVNIVVKVLLCITASYMAGHIWYAL